jgi:MOSC domain-containing protein YiiM
MASVCSVNVGTPQEVPWTRGGRTAIDKRPADGRVAVRALGLEGDQVSNRRHHGGVEKAVYAFAREDLDRWGQELGRELPDGFFGENLTTGGIDVNEAEIGERWRVGTAELEVAGVRTPCRVFSSWLRVSGLDNRSWARRFTAVGRPGPYLRVVSEGYVAAGDELAVLHRPGHGVTVTAMFRAVMAGDASGARKLTLATRESDK